MLVFAFSGLSFSATVGIISCWAIWRYFFLRRKFYPPGPRESNWITGHASALSSGKIWDTYTAWAGTYGKIMSLRVFGDRIIVLNSFDVATDLLEKRSHIYSDRPYIAMVDMMNWDFTTAFKPYGVEWRAHRRLMQQSFKADASRNFRPIQIKKMNDMLIGLLLSPDDFRSHTKTLAAAIAMSAMYGHDISPKGDYFVTLAEAGVLGLSRSTFPSAALVNALPFLQTLPTWFPGTSFKRYALSVRDLTVQMQEVPYNHVKKSLAAGAATSSWVADRLDDCKSEFEDRMLREVAATAYAAGADTSSAAILTFFLAMNKFPHVQKKAQREIDSVVGNERRINYQDQDSLPYTQAIMREIFRWRPVLPLCVAHATKEEDVYEGHYIPKGAIVVPNIWGMTRDLVKYKDPEVFNPDRFFDEYGNLNDDDMSYVFGFGRRICAGRHIGSATVWLTIANVLAMFDIEPKRDASGKELPLNVDYTSDLISHPLPFQCSISLRSENSRKIIMNVNVQS